jgi:YfiR/HmsC-like
MSGIFYLTTVCRFLAAALLLEVAAAGMQLPQHVAEDAKQGVSLEYQVKAAYLLNFTKFIDWPPDAAGADGDAPFILCIAGENPFGAVLEQMMQGQKVGGRPIEIQRMGQNTNKGCQVVYFSATGKGVRKAVEGLGPGVLTVGEGESFIKEGGMIAFVLEDRRVKFDVNLSATRGAMLTLSSRLLAIAKWVGK